VACHSLNVLSPLLLFSPQVGAYCIFRLDMRKGTITYITRHGERECPIATTDPLVPALDSDENGEYLIEWDGPASFGGGGGGSVARVAEASEAWRGPRHPEAAALERPCPALALDLLHGVLLPVASSAAAAPSSGAASTAAGQARTSSGGGGGSGAAGCGGGACSVGEAVAGLVFRQEVLGALVRMSEGPGSGGGGAVGGTAFDPYHYDGGGGCDEDEDGSEDGDGNGSVDPLSALRCIALFLEAANGHRRSSGGRHGGGGFDLSKLSRLGRMMDWMHSKEKASGKPFSSHLSALVQVR